MKMRLNLMRALAAAGILSLAGMLIGAEKVLALAEVMNQLTILHNRVEAAFLKGKDLRAVPASLDEIDGLYVQVAGSYDPVYGGSEPAWKDYCERSRAALRDAKSSLAAGDDKAAYGAFGRLAVLREKAHDDFQPGLWKRLKRRFQKKKSKENV
jgi:hypothetical protein